MLPTKRDSPNQGSNLMKSPILDVAISPKLAPRIHESFSRLSRRLRSIKLPHGLTNERLSTLVAIGLHEPVSISALSITELVSVPTMSRMIDALEAEGFARRRENKSDARGILISTTAKGRRAYQEAVQQSLGNLITTLNSLGPQGLTAIRTLLSVVDGSHFYEHAGPPVGLCYLDTDLRYRYINEWLASINGMSVEAHLGKKIEDILKHVAAIVVPQLRSVLDTGEAIIEGSVEAETPAHPGQARQFTHNYYPDKTKDGSVVGVSCVVQDICYLPGRVESP